MKKFFAIAVLLTLAACAGSQMELPNWAPINASRFPTDIGLIAFASGFAISQTSGVTIPNGSWTIQFPGGGNVVATNPETGYLHVSPLRCTSQAVGEQPCYLSLMYRPGDSLSCNLIVGTLPGGQQSGTSSFTLICPDLWTPPS